MCPCSSPFPEKKKDFEKEVQMVAKQGGETNETKGNGKGAWLPSLLGWTSTVLWDTVEIERNDPIPLREASKE